MAVVLIAGLTALAVGCAEDGTASWSGDELRTLAGPTVAAQGATVEYVLYGEPSRAFLSRPWG